MPHDSLHVTHIVTLCKNLVCDNEDKEDDAEVAMLTEVLRVILIFALFRLFAFFCLFLFLYFFSTRYIRDSSFTKQECKMHIIMNQIIIV